MTGTDPQLASRLARGRKAIGTGATVALAAVLFWAGAPDWALAAVPVLSLVATWGLPNAPTKRQLDQVRAGRYS